ncbi:hypothetical protein ACFPM0_10705 [Pseudonocardia sulfidoxydans]|uniref:hypothetical protein n=1 Tax=Pseudonocardia sulfidoxydans TaxID=54011 RepID=UPI00361E3151
MTSSFTRSSSHGDTRAPQPADAGHRRRTQTLSRHRDGVVVGDGRGPPRRR